jgi:uncharacterized membrane protein YbaN (DUF454 family)
MFRLVAGSMLLIVGVIGGFIPVLQGWIFILLGLSIIAPESERARRLLEWARTKAQAGTSRSARAATGTVPGKMQAPGPTSGSSRSAEEGRNP